MESFAYGTNKMEELFDYGPDLLSDRASFQALIDELYPADTSMQLDVEFSSRDTSPPGPDTPPSSSGGGQEDVASLETGHEHQAFAQGALMTEMLAGMRGSTPTDLMRAGTNTYHDLNMIESSFQDSYLGLPSSSQYPPSQMPAYTWESFPERPLQYGAVYGTNLSWTDPAAINFNNPDPSCYPSGQAFFDPTAFIPRSMMTVPHNSFPQSTTDGIERGLVAAQEPMPLNTLQPDDVIIRYRQLSSPEAMMVNTGYQVNTSPSVLIGLDMSGQPVINTSQQPATSLVTQQQPVVVERTHTSPVKDTAIPETADLPIRNYRSRESINSRSPEAARRGIASQPSSSRGSSPRPIHKGGRQGGLDGNTRAHANQMRKLGACWICAFQRDQCDPGSPCTRCQDRSIRGSLHMLPCSRIHLQELVHQFLPATMNKQHRREEILAFAKKSLGSWRQDAPIQVHLTSLGLGNFSWDLHEYEPSSQDLLLQKRYKMGIAGTWQRIEKRSPPLAVKQVNFGHMHKLEEYVDNIIDRHLAMFQQQIYYGEEDSTAAFQNELLQALCSLYTSLPDEDDDKTLKGDLRHVLRLQILTAIMEHPITISSATLPTVIASMTTHNNPSLYTSWTSPFLANRQLKYYFAEMQTLQYNRTLNRLHQILRKAGDKNKLWMSSFVLMLGIASVLESCQHLLWIKADAKVSRGETSSVDAAWEARSHCAEMDDGFEFLCKLYHCKYRGKHRQKTRYEELKGKTTRVAEQVFADRIYEIVDRNGGYLLHRQNLIVNGMQDNNHASRLVARFLVELMGLTQSSP
ncbi:hypothetical protein M436DRAFT_58750 [Aureobasidium namibiae CBS 147.97]|uniref:Zn(2)-C6 fungal-type domain-containing protein n=1 Tax=Aureobasidium namibiae CBS 147.97 TaxID=1043004 RepID=A0A074W579_9PEZI